METNVPTTPGSDVPQSTRVKAFDFIESELLAALGVSAITPQWIYLLCPLAQIKTFIELIDLVL